MREACRAGDERQIGQREAVRLLKRLLALAADTVDGGEVDLDRLEDMRDRPPVFGQPVRRFQPHGVQAMIVWPLKGAGGAAYRGASRRRRAPKLAASAAMAERTTLLVDPAAAALLDLRGKPRDVEAVLRDQPARERRDAHAVAAPWRDRTAPSGVETSSNGERHGAAFGAAACSASGCGAALAGDSPPITATIAPTFATSPAPTRISFSRPATIAWTSIVTLSVSTSNRLSPSLISSPTDLNQAEDLSLGNGFAELRHDDGVGHQTSRS